MASERFDDEKYIGWLKLSLSLTFAKEGLETFTDDEVKAFHDKIRSKLSTSSESESHICNDKDSLRKQWQKGKFRCQADNCDKWLSEIRKNHKNPSFSVEWDNSDVSQLSTQPWECAKLFMSTGCQNYTCAKDADIAALLTLYLRCTHFYTFFSKMEDCEQIRKIRNRVMHSCSMEVDTATMQRDTKMILKFLEDPEHLINDKGCKDAVQKIEELLSGKVELSLNKDLELRVLHAEFRRLRDVVDQLTRSNSDSDAKEGERQKLEIIDIRQQLSEVTSRIKAFNHTGKTSQHGIDCQQINEEQTAMKRKLTEIENVLKPKRKRVPYGEDDVKDLQKELVSFYKENRQRVPIYPLRPECKTDVEDLFVKPTMAVMDPSEIRFLHTTGRRGLVSHRETTEAVLENIRDIFFEGNKLCNNIYIMGKCGTGKSTLCEYLVHLWVRCQSENDQNLREENFMDVFTFLFYISLREANSCDVEGMIMSQLELKDVEISRLLSNHTCLIILDGLDEFAQKEASGSTSQNIPTIRHSEKCTVLTTSRPWKLELLGRRLEDKIKRQISITGLNKTAQLELAKKIVDVLQNSEREQDASPHSEFGPDRTSTDFVKEMEDNKLDKFLETPVLLTQLLGLWMSGESLGNSQCAIYTTLIEKQLQIAKEYEKVSAGFHTNEQLPACFNGRIHCQTHKSLLLKLSRFAYESLFSKSKETSLVFDHEQMEVCGMSNNEIQDALGMGLLTQYKVFRKITKRQRSISFVHKSHQEFFAAIYLSQIVRSSDLKLEEYFTDLDRVLEIEKVFMFVSGMNPNVSYEISKVIMNKVSTDSRVQEYRHSCIHFIAPYADLVKRVQGLILAGIEEGENNGHSITSIQLQDIWAVNEDKEFPPTRLIRCTNSLDVSHIKSICMHTPDGISQDIIWQLIKTTLPNLHQLVLTDCDITVDMVLEFVDIVQKCVSHNPRILKAMGLYYHNIPKVDFSQLEPTYLQGILLAPKSSLGLDGIILTHTQLESLCEHLSKCPHNEIRLINLICKTHRDSAGDCGHDLDLTSSENISRLELGNLPLRTVLFNPENLMVCVMTYLPDIVAASMICCLKKASKLERFWWYGLRGSAAKELKSTLPFLVNLKLIVLVDINLSGPEQIILSQDMKKLEEIGLYNVTLTSEHFQSLLSTISSHRVVVDMGHRKQGPVNITNYRRENDIIQQTKDDPNTDVEEDEVEYLDDTCTCIVRRLVFTLTKYQEGRAVNRHISNVVGKWPNWPPYKNPEN